MKDFFYTLGFVVIGLMLLDYSEILPKEDVQDFLVPEKIERERPDRSFKPGRNGLKFKGISKYNCICATSEGACFFDENEDQVMEFKTVDVPDGERLEPEYIQINCMIAGRGK